MELKNIAESKLTQLFNDAPSFPLEANSKYIIFSDLHLYDGGPKDIFKKNAALMERVLKEHYFLKGYTLILNGDIEELMLWKNYTEIRQAYKHTIYSAFDTFALENRLIKLVGNHDLGIAAQCPDYEIHEAVKLCDSKGHSIFIHHGHHIAAINNGYYNNILSFLLKIAYTVGGRNYPVAQDNQEKYAIEKNAYAFSSARGIVSILGHTHRPLFESHSKKDYLIYMLEQYIAEYAQTKNTQKKQQIKTQITSLKKELMDISIKPKYALPNKTYSEDILVPALFNSGCCIDKKGITGIEIAHGNISLVSWTDAARYKKQTHKREKHGYLERPRTKSFFDKAIFRTIIRNNALDNILNRLDALKD